MTKKLLKIKLVKFDYALAMQILEQEGKFEISKHIKISDYPWLASDHIFFKRRAY